MREVPGVERIKTTELPKHIGERVAMAGWVHHQRHLARVSFLLLRDVNGIAQVVVGDDVTRGIASELLPETVIEVDGTVVASPQAPGGVELHDPAFTVLARG
jgi:nondiscriminating aspartyl-tRNA synthetase